jgi:hypothetical protein
VWDVLFFRAKGGGLEMSWLGRWIDDHFVVKKWVEVPPERNNRFGCASSADRTQARVDLREVVSHGKLKGEELAENAPLTDLASGE